MGEQRPAIITNEVEDDLLDRPPAEIIVHLHPADDLTAEDPDVVAVLAQGLARQSSGQHFAQERLEASTIRSRYGMSRFSYAQLPGH